MAIKLFESSMRTKVPELMSLAPGKALSILPQSITVGTKARVR